MKKREITNKELEQLFSRLVEQKPLLDEEQAALLLNKLPMEPSLSAFKKFFQSQLNILIVGVILMSIVIGSILWMNNNDDTDNAIQPNQSNQTDFVSVAAEPVEKTVDAEDVVHDIKNEVPVILVEPVKALPKDTIHVADIYKKFNKTPQSFSILANRDTTILCDEGTTIKIKAYSFITEEKGNEVSGEIQIKVQEYYKVDEMIQSNLSTSSDNELLETGGMLYISARSEDGICILKKGRSIDIGFPYSKKEEDMALFSGEWTNHKINWKLADTASSAGKTDAVVITATPVREQVVSDEVFIYVEQMPEFPGGTKAMDRWIRQHTQYPFSALANKIEGRVYVSFIVDTMGIASDIFVARSLDSTLDKVAVNLVRDMPAWKPAMQRGKPVRVSYTIPVDFTFNDKALTDEEILQSKVLEEKIKDIKVYYQKSDLQKRKEAFKDEFEKKVSDVNLQQTNVSDVSRYVFSTSQLGWINCDRFVKSRNPKTDYSIMIDQPDKARVNIIFHRFKTILPGKVEFDRISFSNVPLGEKITIVALKTDHNKLYLAVKETVITNKVESSLDFQPVTMDVLKKEMIKLNMDK
ncbi:MAG: energy transducer TonB [Prolixibacteraceae bacterium]